MATFNITVNLDWLNEEENLDERLRDEILSGIVAKVGANITNSLEGKAKELLDAKMASLENEIGEKLNAMMLEFFDTPKDITDQWGDIVRRGVTVREQLKESCSQYLDQKVDSSGRPASGYGSCKTRLEYILDKAVNSDMEYAIKRATTEVTDKIKKKITEEVKMQIGEKLADVIGLDSMMGNKKVVL